MSTCLVYLNFLSLFPSACSFLSLSSLFSLSLYISLSSLFSLSLFICLSFLSFLSVSLYLSLSPLFSLCLSLSLSPAFLPCSIFFPFFFLIPSPFPSPPFPSFPPPSLPISLPPFLCPFFLLCFPSLFPSSLSPKRHGQRSHPGEDNKPSSRQSSNLPALTDGDRLHSTKGCSAAVYLAYILDEHTPLYPGSPCHEHHLRGN